MQGHFFSTALVIPHITSVWTTECPFNGSAPQSIQEISADLNKCENVYLKFDLF